MCSVNIGKHCVDTRHHNNLLKESIVYRVYLKPYIIYIRTYIDTDRQTCVHTYVHITHVQIYGYNSCIFTLFTFIIYHVVYLNLVTKYPNQALKALNP